MSDDSELQRRVAALEGELETVRSRLNQLEAAVPSMDVVAPAPAPVVPPPVQTAPVWKGSISHREERLRTPIAFELPEPSRPPNARPNALAKFEYDFGAKVLPWAGAIVVIVAIGIFVANAIQRGLITPQMQFVGAIILSLGFIATGFKKHNEREDFGKILIAIGSCGVYLSFAGGHVFLQLFSAETMIGAFFLWSAANLVYGAKTRSTAFLMLGFLGGMSAALMPLAESKYATSIALQFLILVPCLAIAVIQRRSVQVAAMWAIGFFGILAAVTDHSMRDSGAAALLCVSLLGVAAYLYAFEPQAMDPTGNFAAAPVLLTALLLWLMDLTSHSAEFIVILGAMAIALGLLKKREGVTNAVLGAGVVVITAIAPLCLDRVLGYFSLLAFAILGAAIAWKRRSSLPLPIAWLNLATGSLCYWAASNTLYAISPFAQLFATALLAAGIVMTCIATGRLEGKDPDMISGLGIMLLSPVMAIFFAQVGWMFRHDVAIAQLAICYGAVVYAAVLTLFLGHKLPLTRKLIWLILGGAAGAYLDLFMGVQPGIKLEIPFLVLSLAGLYFVGKATLLETHQAQQENSLVAMGSAASFVLARIIALILTQTAISATKVNGSTMAFSLVGILCCGMIYWRPRQALGYLAWLNAGLAVASTARLVTENPPMSVVLLMLGVIGAAGWSSTRIAVMQDAGPALAVIINWLFFTVFVHLLIGPNVVLNSDLTTTLSWITYGVLLLIIGFWRDHRIVRLGAIAIFAISTLKMFLVDLAMHMDVLARVGILFLLGFAMLAGGYWYLRSKVIDRPAGDL